MILHWKSFTFIKVHTLPTVKSNMGDGGREIELIPLFHGPLISVKKGLVSEEVHIHQFNGVLEFRKSYKI